MSTPPENQPRQVERARVHHRTPVFAYLAILFAVAFLMLLLAYFQQQRANRESTDALKESASAVQSIQLLMEDNDKLREQVKELEEKLSELEKSQRAAADDTQAWSQKYQREVNASNAMQWFWQIESAYAKEKLGTTRELIQKFEETGLPKYLPSENTTGTQRFSPAARYQEIYDALF